jgi:hypothetical protein
MNATDAVEEHLRDLIIDLYDFIIEESGQGPSQMVPPIFQRVAEHRSYDALVVLIAQDESLVKFFPALKETTGQGHSVDFLKRLQTIVIWSDGSSEGMTPLTLCCSIIRGVFRVLWSWDDLPSLDDALKQLPKAIDLARDLAEKRPVKIPAVVAIHNIKLMHDRAIPIGSAVLREPICFDRSCLFDMALGPKIDTVLRLDVDFTVLHIRGTDQNKDRDKEHQETLKLIETLGYKSAEQQARRIQDAIDLARLAVALSSSPGRLFAPVQGLSAAVNPMAEISSAGISSARSLQAPYPAQDISVSVEQQIARYAQLLERHPNVLRTGVRRLLLAITERLYPEDGLVDVVICWESLFSSTPETMLRVCGSMAKLLGPDDVAGRHQLYNQLRDLYLARNKVVHGSESSIETIVRARDAAVQYALDAFREIYQRDDLISVDDSSARGLSVLLGPD